MKRENIWIDPDLSIDKATYLKAILDVLQVHDHASYKVQIDFQDSILLQLEIPATYTLFYDKQNECTKLQTHLLSNDRSVLGNVSTTVRLAGE